MPWNATGGTIRGPQGPAGAQGTPGAQGPQGPKGLTLINPVATDKVPLLYADSGLTLAAVQALVAGTTPSAAFSIRYGADFSAAGTEVRVGGMTASSSTTGNGWTTFENAAIPAGSWLWLVVGTVSGTVSSLHVALRFAG